MGTENLQKLSNKRSNKTIHFTDHSIEKFKPTLETKRVKVGFPRSHVQSHLKHFRPTLHTKNRIFKKL